MTRKVKNYYTFKVLGQDPLRFQAVKWDIAGEPETTYNIDPNAYCVAACSCPAWRWDCKHRKCVEYILEHHLTGELHKWKWDEVNGWQQLNDMKEDFDL